MELERDLQERRKLLLKRLREDRPASQVPFDTTAMVLLGTGAGTAMQGCWKIGSLLTLWGLARATRRFVVHKVDNNDMAGLFRWIPAKLCERRGELFAQLKREIHAARALRAGDKSFIEATARARPGGHAMDSRYDHTPETLFAEAMTSVAVHPRVQDALGSGVHPVAEPDKVVYRMHEGISEVFLGWEVAGALGAAEVQVKATASLVDFIYVFPQTGDKYGLRKPGFVIRPQGNWSMDCSELPKDMKQPFGSGSGDDGRLYRNREGVFEYDYEVRDFRHGYENHPRKRAKEWW